MPPRIHARGPLRVARPGLAARACSIDGDRGSPGVARPPPPRPASAPRTVGPGPSGRPTRRRAGGHATAGGDPDAARGLVAPGMGRGRRGSVRRAPSAMGKAGRRRSGPLLAVPPGPGPGGVPREPRGDGSGDDAPPTGRERRPLSRQAHPPTLATAASVRRAVPWRTVPGSAEADDEAVACSGHVRQDPVPVAALPVVATGRERPATRPCSVVPLGATPLAAGVPVTGVAERIGPPRRGRFRRRRPVRLRDHARSRLPRRLRSRRGVVQGPRPTRRATSPGGGTRPSTGGRPPRRKSPRPSGRGGPPRRSLAPGPRTRCDAAEPPLTTGGAEARTSPAPRRPRSDAPARDAPGGGVPGARAPRISPRTRGWGTHRPCRRTRAVRARARSRRRRRWTGSRAGSCAGCSPGCWRCRRSRRRRAG